MKLTPVQEDRKLQRISKDINRRPRNQPMRLDVEWEKNLVTSTEMCLVRVSRNPPNCASPVAGGCVCFAVEDQKRKGCMRFDSGEITAHVQRSHVLFTHLTRSSRSVALWPSNAMLDKGLHRRFLKYIMSYLIHRQLQ